MSLTKDYLPEDIDVTDPNEPAWTAGAANGVAFTTTELIKFTGDSVSIYRRHNPIPHHLKEELGDYSPWDEGMWLDEATK